MPAEALLELTMLDKVSLLPATAAISLCAGSAGAATLNFANDNHHRNGGPSLSVDIGAVAFGFDDAIPDIAGTAGATAKPSQSRGCPEQVERRAPSDFVQA